MVGGGGGGIERYGFVGFLTYHHTHSRRETYIDLEGYGSRNYHTLRERDQNQIKGRRSLKEAQISFRIQTKSNTLSMRIESIR
jgi:hypothetical protein